MGDIAFEPVLSELIPLVKDLKFSVMYFGRHCGKNILISKHQSKTVMVVLGNDNQWSVEFTTTISSRGRSVRTSRKIIGNENTILLLDGEGNLWKLINAFEFSNEKDECLYLIDEKCYYEWVPLKKFETQKVFGMTAFQSQFALIVENGQGEKALQIFSSKNLSYQEDHTFQELNYSVSHNYLLTELNVNVQKSENKGSEKAIVIADNTNGTTFILCSSRKAHVLNNSNEVLISVLFFNNTKCLFLCYQNGRFEFVILNDECQPTRSCSVFVFKNVICIEKCDCCETCVIWSDGLNLQHTNIHFQFERTRFVKVSHLHVAHNVIGVIALTKTSCGIMAVTINQFYYNIILNRFVKPKEIFMSSDDILTKIFEGGLTINKLNDDIDIATEYFVFKEIKQTNRLQEQVEISVEDEHILLKLNAKYVFRKNFWRVRQSSSVDNKHFVEYNDLETDLHEGMMIKLKSNFMSKNQIEISLVGDFGKDFDILSLYLGTVTVGRSNEEEIIEKTLNEIARRRNPYLKLKSFSNVER